MAGRIEPSTGAGSVLKVLVNRMMFSSHRLGRLFFGLGSLFLLGLWLGAASAGADDVTSSAAPATAITPSGFLFQDGAKPVLFIGDDATAQRMFTTLIETYALSRFPGWNVPFRNVGWEGDKIRFAGIRATTADQAIRRDIQSLHPQVALANYGLNDAAGGDASYDQFLVGVNVLARDLPRVGVYRSVFISPTPKEGYDGSSPAGSPDNLMLLKYAAGMKERFPIGWQNGVDFMTLHPKGTEVPLAQNGVFIDATGPMIALIEAGRKAGVLSPDDSLGDKTARLTLDGVHLNWSGHLVLAALILQGIQAPDLVSSATLNGADRTTTAAQGCTITWQDAPAGAIQFERKDEALPWPIPPEADLALKLPGFDPATTLNRYELKVTGLTGASYRLTIDGEEIGVYAQAELAQGINLGFMRRGPIYAQGQKLLQAVEAKNDAFFNRWRTVQIGGAPAPGTSADDLAAHAAEVKAELPKLDQAIAGQEAVIHGLCQPVAHVFRLEPVGP